MKPTSKILHILALFVAATAATSLWAASDPLFTVVPSGDATYARLQQIESAGLLPAGAAQGPLTRFEVAERILTAESRYRQIVVAQADTNLLPPLDGLPPELPTSNSTAPASMGTPLTAEPAMASPSGASPAPSTSGSLDLLPPPEGLPPAVPEAATSSAGPAPVPTAQATPMATPVVSEGATYSLDELRLAAQNLNSLQDAYQYELHSIQYAVKSTQDQATTLVGNQYQLWKRLKGITEYPTITWHGLGRAFAISQQYFGSAGTAGLTPATREGIGYLDFEPEGVVSKEVRWDAILRYYTAFEANNAPDIDELVFRRATMEFNPPWFSATLGDFDESYTPLTMWNRDSLDLRYRPEMYSREDDVLKYEGFLNDEPSWPFRGGRIGTSLLWPDSDILGSFKVSVMADMIRNGFNVQASGGSYYGSGIFTGWIFAGQGDLKSKRWFLGGNTSLQLGLGAYMVVLYDPLNSETPNSPYSQFNPATWGHHYQILSFKPSINLGLGDDTSLGLDWEGSTSSYQDDEENTQTIVNDFALMGGPYFRFEDSKVSVNYLNVGPNYFSPLAQTRQDDIASTTVTPNTMPVAELWNAPLRNEFFLTDVPRANEIYSFYDRTQDNTFPYGLATPNREGAGLDMDIKTLENDILRIPASIYFVQEVQENLVVNSGATGYTPVDGSTKARTFTYLNLGPSVDLGPSFGMSTDFTVGVNMRYEQTDSSFGTLNSTWVLGGVQTGLFPWWELAVSFGVQQANGSEAGYDGTFLARYSYTYNNQDLGQYQAFNVNGSDQSWRISSAFQVDRNSSLYLDYGLTWGNIIPYYGKIPSGSLSNQLMELSYEIQF